VLEAAAQKIRATGRDVRTTADMRDLLKADDIDAFVIASPNHLHAMQAIWACQAGKDVYLEKPVSHNLWEGRKIVEAADKYKRMVQVGSQCRSSDSLAEAVAWVKAGNLGKITAARGLCYKRRDTIGLTTGPQPVPSTVNYDLWLGPAADAQPRRTKFHYDWHWFWEYGNGDLGNQGVHQVDIARWFLGEKALAPRVLTAGGRLGYKDDASTPNTLVVALDYPTAPLLFEVRGLPTATGGRAMDSFHPANLPANVGASIGVIVHCEGGTIVVPDYVSAHAYDKEGKLLKDFTGSSSHAANFIAAVRSRKTSDLNAPIAEGNVSSGLAHMANIAHHLGKGTAPDAIREQVKGNAAFAEMYDRMATHLGANGIDFAQTPVTLGMPLTLDPVKEQFTDNAPANALVKPAYRAPFLVPEAV
jgi:predicted dehydrogenase